MQQKTLVIDVTTVDSTDTDLQGYINEIIAKGVKIVLALEDVSLLPDETVRALFTNANVSLVTYVELKNNKYKFEKELTTCLMNSGNSSFNIAFRTNLTSNYSKCEYIDKSGLSQQLKTYHELQTPTRRAGSTNPTFAQNQRLVKSSIGGGDVTSQPTSPALKQTEIKDKSKDTLNSSPTFVLPQQQSPTQQNNDLEQPLTHQPIQVSSTIVDQNQTTNQSFQLPPPISSQHDATHVQSEEITQVVRQTSTQHTQIALPTTFPLSNDSLPLPSFSQQHQPGIATSTEKQTNFQQNQPPLPNTIPQSPLVGVSTIFPSQQPSHLPTPYQVSSVKPKQSEIAKTTNVEQFGIFWCGILVKPSLLVNPPKITLNAVGRLRIEIMDVEYANLKPRVECLAGIFKYHELSECLVGEFDNFAQLGPALNTLKCPLDIKIVYQELCPIHGLDAEQAWAEFVTPEIINCQKLIYTMLKSFIHIDDADTVSCPKINVNDEGVVSITLDLPEKGNTEEVSSLTELIVKSELRNHFAIKGNSATATIETAADLKELLNQFVQLSHLNTDRDFPKLGLCMPHMESFYKELCQQNSLDFDDVWKKANLTTKPEHKPDRETCSMM